MSAAAMPGRVGRGVDPARAGQLERGLDPERAVEMEVELGLRHGLDGASQGDAGGRLGHGVVHAADATLQPCRPSS